MRIFDHKGIPVILSLFEAKLARADLRPRESRCLRPEVVSISIDATQRQLPSRDRLIVVVWRPGDHRGCWHIVVLVKTVSEGAEGPIADDSDGGNGCQKTELLHG